MIPFYIRNYVIYVFLVQLLIPESETHGNVKKCLTKAGKFPIADSCTLYFICENWKVIREEKCSSGDHFNPIKGECDWEELYPCTEKLKSKHCPKLNGRFVKPESECRKYFDCCDGKATEKKCPRSTLFDSKKEKCEYEELVTCEEKPNRNKCPKPNGRFVKPYSDCRKYFECKNGQPSEKKCTTGMLFDEETQKCEREKYVSCKDKRKECPEPNGRFVKPSSECRKYYVCKNGEPEEKRCGRGSLFNVKTEKCEPENLVSCKEEDGSKESSSEESGESTLESTTTSIFDKITSTLKPKHKKCPKPNGRFVKPYSECRKYFDCRNGQPTEKKCPSHQLFNVKSGKCEWKERVSCEKDDASSESSSEESDESTSVSTSISDKISSTFKPQTSVFTDIFSSSTTEATISSQLTTRSTSEDTSSSFPTEYTTPEETSSSFPTDYTTPEETSSSFPTEDTTPEEASSSFPTEDTTPEETSSSFPTEDTTPEKTSEDVIFETRVSSTSIKHTSLTPSVREIRSSTVETSSQSPLSTKSTTNIIETTLSTKSPPKTSTSDPVKDFICPEATGYFPHPYDKHKFIGCVHYIPYEMVCPANLIYDPKQQRCVYG